MAEIIFKSGSRLSETLNLILDLSKLESEKMDFTYQQIDLVSETEGIINLFYETARKKGLSLKIIIQPANYIYKI
jgi:signal transduction histidine kinase